MTEPRTSFAHTDSRGVAKRTYSKEGAKRAAKMLRSQRAPDGRPANVRVYRCPECDNWHVGRSDGPPK